MTGCSLQLLGGFKISIDGVDLTSTVSTGKARLLLAYLALKMDKPVRRKQLAFDFWPDSTEKQALSNLRKLLHDLRESLPHIDQYLQFTQAYIQWRGENPAHSDVSRFEEAAQGATVSDLTQAVELYKGELLQGLHEDWIEAKRDLLAQSYDHTLERLIVILESRREYSLALFYANKLMVRNYLREETYRILMRLHAFNKDMAGVIQTYRKMKDLLQAELGIEPAGETVSLYEAIVKNGIEASGVSHDQVRLVNRAAEWESMLDAWNQVSEGKTSLLVLCGEAGIGKTRLMDPIQWSDGETLQFLSYLLRNDSKAKLIVVTTMQTETELEPISEQETNQLLSKLVGEELANLQGSRV